jgi:Galactose oxidase, central domain
MRMRTTIFSWAIRFVQLQFFFLLHVVIITTTYANHVLPVAFQYTTLTKNATLPKALSDFTAVLSTDSDDDEDPIIYIHGGCDSVNGNTYYKTTGFFQCNSISNASYAYHISTQTWTNLPNLPTARYRHATVVLPQRHLIYILGGRNLTDEIVTTLDARIPYLLYYRNWLVVVNVKLKIYVM